MARIVVYVQDLRATGVVRNAMAIAARLAEEHEVTLLAGDANGLFAEAAARGPYALRTIRPEPDGRYPRLALVPPLREALRALRPDLVLSRGNYGHGSLFLASRGMRAPRVYVISNEVTDRAGLVKKVSRGLANRLLLADAARVVIVGRRQAEAPLFRAAIARGQAVHIANGIDLASVGGAQGPAPHPWLSDRSVPTVLSVGRLHRQKNLGRLIEAIAIARRTRPLRLIMLGGGVAGYREHLEAAARDAGVEAAVAFAGEVAEVQPWLAHANLFALPSLWEGSSMALLEALAAGVPVLASRQAGDAAYVLEEGRYGVLVDALDPASIADGLLRQSGPEPIRPGERVKDFALSRTLDAYAALVTEVLSRPAPSA